VAPVHRDQVDVHVDEKVALRGPPVDGHHLAEVGALQLHHPVGVLGVVVVVALGVVGVEDLLPHHPLHLRLGHPAVERVGDDQMHVVHAAVGE
jgi:hypothetical protein